MPSQEEHQASKQVEKANQNKVLAFDICGQLFGLPTKEVQEVILYVTPHALAEAGEFLTGVIDLRGTALPVVDLHAVLETGTSPKVDDETCYVIAAFGKPEARMQLAFAVDQVHACIRLDDSNIVPSPMIGNREFAPHIRSVGVTEESIVLILDLDVLLTTRGLLEAAKNPPVDEEVST